MTNEEKQKAIDVLKISAPLMAMTQEEFDDYIKIINQVMDWLEQEQTACDLEQIRAEFINKYPKNYANEPELGGRSCVFSLNEVLQIIDKYTGGE